MDDPRRHFDFWVGRWRCAWDGGAGTNVVDTVCDGAVVRESFESDDGSLIGTSLSVYDPVAGCWVQTWMDSQRSWFHLTGHFDSGALDLVTTTEDPQGRRFRMRFAGISDEGFDWTWSGSSPDGRWEPRWAIRYQRDRASR